MYLVSVLAMLLSFRYGRSFNNFSVGQFFGLLFLAFVIGISSTFVTFFVHMFCEAVDFCAKTHDMNVFHVVIPTMFFPVFWLAIILGCASNKNFPLIKNK
jgi:magnesium-transporting ATPase (P-type)